MKKILLVEDDLMLAATQRMNLINAGYDVEVLHTGEACIEKCGRGCPDVDLILMDIDLGSGVDGIDTALEVLKHRDIPIVFLSSHQEAEVLKRTESASNFGYVVKDTSFAVLEGAINLAFRLDDAIAERDSAEAKLQKVFRGVDTVAIQGYDMNGICRVWNHGAEVVYGYTEEEAIGKSIYDLIIREEDREQAEKEFQQLNEQQKAFPTTDYKFRKKDGEVVFVRSSHTLIKTREGYELFCMDVDLSEIKALLAKNTTILREAHHRMKNSFLSLERVIGAESAAATEAETRRVLNDLAGRTQSARLVYSKLLETREMNMIDIKSYFDSFIETIISIFKETSHITVEKHIDSNIMLTSEQTFSLGVIVNEFITNSMKYGFEKGKQGLLSLTIQQTDNVLSFHIFDDGDGMTEEEMSRGVQGDSGLGMILIRTMAASFNQDYQFYNDNGLHIAFESELPPIVESKMEDT